MPNNTVNPAAKLFDPTPIPLIFTCNGEGLVISDGRFHRYIIELTAEGYQNVWASLEGKEPIGFLGRYDSLSAAQARCNNHNHFQECRDAWHLTDGARDIQCPTCQED